MGESEKLIADLERRVHAALTARRRSVDTTRARSARLQGSRARVSALAIYELRKSEIVDEAVACFFERFADSTRAG